MKITLELKQNQARNIQQFADAAVRARGLHYART
jgi:hypothetical protein